MVEHAITFDWLREYESLRMRGHWRWDLLKVLPRFPYVRTGSNDSIYDTSIIEVVDIPCRNSPYYVVYTRTWIFEPSVYFEWLWDRVTSLCRCLLLRQAFSESRHFSWDSDPANTMAYDSLPHDWSYQGDVMRKKPFLLGKNLPAWWWVTICGVRIVYYYWNVKVCWE